MSKRHVLLWSVVAVMAVGAWTETRSEVSVRVNRRGEYVRVRVLPVGPDGEIWTVFQRNLRHRRAARAAGVSIGLNIIRPLNRRGDRNGDLAPSISESPLAPYHPWVVWSRNNGQDFDLAFSRWTTAGWSPITWVEDRTDQRQDLDPTLLFDQAGRPYLAWWREEGGQGRVYITMFLRTRWMRPIVISPAGSDGRRPTLQMLGQDRIRVTYSAPGTETGEASQTVRLFRPGPGTITDDIDPQAMMRLMGPPDFGQQMP